jgi:hypothetical protein
MKICNAYNKSILYALNIIDIGWNAIYVIKCIEYNHRIQLDAIYKTSWG